MFCFGREEYNYKSKRVANYRMDDFRHNPYVGSFHAVPYKAEEASQTDDQLFLMSEAKTNPMVGLFRHSPPIVTSQQSPQNHRIGLKSVIYEENQNQSSSLPIISRLRLNTSLPRSTLTGRTFLSSLRKLPVTVYCSPSPQTSSSIASISVADGQPTNSQRTDDVREEKPMCAICLEEYADGDELFTLACSHCFHSECVNRWFYHGCISSNRYFSRTSAPSPSLPVSSSSKPSGRAASTFEAFQEAFRCPACRQDHIALSEQGSVAEVSLCQSTFTRNTVTAVSLVEVVEVSSNDEGIPMGSFYDLGQSLLLDGGYDFLSDVGSEMNSVSSMQPHSQLPIPPAISAPIRLQAQSPSLLSPMRNIKTTARKSLEESVYSDCGFPLSSPQRITQTVGKNI